jgi:alkylhydroperoxidase/carboxymuconolactone decarboxylase family protein YurZ
MSTTTSEHSAPAERSQSDRSAPERPERKEPTYLFTEKYVADKSETARRFIETRARLNANVDKANNFLVKRFYNIDHNTYLEGTLPAKTKELMGLVASACLRCDDCIFYRDPGLPAGRNSIRAGRIARRGSGGGRKHHGSAFAAGVRVVGRDVRLIVFNLDAATLKSVV